MRYLSTVAVLLAALLAIPGPALASPFDFPATPPALEQSLQFPDLWQTPVVPTLDQSLVAPSFWTNTSGSTPAQITPLGVGNMAAPGQVPTMPALWPGQGIPAFWPHPDNTASLWIFNSLMALGQSDAIPELFNWFGVLGSQYDDGSLNAAIAAARAAEGTGAATLVSPPDDPLWLTGATPGGQQTSSDLPEWSGVLIGPPDTWTSAPSAPPVLPETPVLSEEDEVVTVEGEVTPCGQPSQACFMVEEFRLVGADETLRALVGELVRVSGTPMPSDRAGEVAHLLVRGVVILYRPEVSERDAAVRIAETFATALFAADEGLLTAVSDPDYLAAAREMQARLAGATLQGTPEVTPMRFLAEYATVQIDVTYQQGSATRAAVYLVSLVKQANAWQVASAVSLLDVEI